VDEDGSFYVSAWTTKIHRAYSVGENCSSTSDDVNWWYGDDLSNHIQRSWFLPFLADKLTTWAVCICEGGRNAISSADRYIKVQSKRPEDYPRPFWNSSYLILVRVAGVRPQALRRKSHRVAVLEAKRDVLDRHCGTDMSRPRLAKLSPGMTADVVFLEQRIGKFPRPSGRCANNPAFTYIAAFGAGTRLTAFLPCQDILKQQPATLEGSRDLGLERNALVSAKQGGIS